MTTSKILIVVTSHDKIDEAHRTGLWLEEFAVPYNEFKRAGYEVTVASTKGGASPLDPSSDKAEAEWAEARKVLQNTLPLSKVNAKDFDGIFMPGGHGTMFDLPDNTYLQKLIGDFAANGKIVAAVCHGPAALVNVTLPDGAPLVSGKTITAFTDDEERASKLDHLMPFLLETRLKDQGADFVVEPNWSDHVERDGKLITGQNPQSSLSVAKAVIEALTPVPS
jgi:putative intracellular protease/amidase